VIQTSVRLYQTVEHACGYWPERLARNLVLAPAEASLAQVYPQALELGFRRSGGTVYRPRCALCSACVPVRLPVALFEPGRRHRRCVGRNDDVELRLVEARRTDENFALYRRYLAHRHRGGGMDQAEPDDFDAFLCCEWAPSRFLELRLGGSLVGIAATDVLPLALSAVYTFFEPELDSRSLGTFAILQQIEWARREGLSHLYLGYWIDSHPKMHYKRQFVPLEALQGGQWRRLG